MANDGTTGTDDATRAETGPGDLSEASRRLLEEGFNEGNFELIDQSTTTPRLRLRCARSAGLSCSSAR
jgi:hypothetical protein